MRREGRVAGKPTNHSRVTGKCKVVNCTKCHEALPLNKSKGKGKGRIKRLLSDIPSTHLLSDWRVSNASLPSTRCLGPRKGARPSLKWDPDTYDAKGDACESEDDAKEPEGWALSISLLLDTALEHFQESVSAKNELQNAGIEGEGPEHEDLTAPHPEGSDDENAADIEEPDFESFKNEFEVFKSEIEAAHNHTSVAESADSWSGIELSEADDSSLDGWEDDWSIVDAIAV